MADQLKFTYFLLFTIQVSHNLFKHEVCLIVSLHIFLLHQNWSESTDPKKYVYKDIAIVSYLMVGMWMCGLPYYAWCVLYSGNIGQEFTLAIMQFEELMMKIFPPKMVDKCSSLMQGSLLVSEI